MFLYLFIINDIGTLLRLYKNKREQKPGWQREILEWCMESAKEKNIKEWDYWGGLVIDEMKVQVYMCACIIHISTNKNWKHKLLGFNQLVKVHEAHYLSSNDGKTLPFMCYQPYIILLKTWCSAENNFHENPIETQQYISTNWFR